MKSVLFGAVIATQATNPEYGRIDGYNISFTTAVGAYKLISTSGTLHSFIGFLNATPTQGSWKYSVYVDGVESVLSMTITTATPSYRTKVMNIGVRVTPGSLICILCTPTGTPTARTFRFSLIFESDKPNESPILAGISTSFLSNTQTMYNSLQGGFTWDSTESNMSRVMPTRGKIKDLYIYLSAAPGAGDWRRFTVMVNGLAATDPVTGNPLQLTISDPDTTGHDAVNILSVVPGDTVSLRAERSANTVDSAYAFWSETFVAEVDGESIVIHGTLNVLNTGAVAYGYLCGYEGNWSTTTTGRLLATWVPVQLRNHYIALSGAPGTGVGEGYTIGIYNSSTTTEYLSLTLTDATTSANTTSTVWATNPGNDYANMHMRCTPISIPVSRWAKWSFVRYYPPDMYSDYDTMCKLRMGKNGGRIPMAKAGLFPLRKTRVR